MSIQKTHRKLYYSLRQTAEMVGVSMAALKGWEAHFPTLRPSRNRAGNRQYTEKEIALLLMIKELLVDRELSPEAAREALKDRRASLENDGHLRLKKALAEIRLEIHEILELLKG